MISTANLVIALPVLIVGLLSMAATAASTSHVDYVDNLERGCPQVNIGRHGAVRMAGTPQFAQVMATVAYRGAFADLDCRWQGPNGSRRQLESVVQKMSSDIYHFRLIVWNSTDADLGRYRFTAQLRRNSTDGVVACEVSEGEAIVQVVSTSKMLPAGVRLEFDVDPSLLNRTPSVTVLTKADGSDSPRLSVTGRLRTTDERNDVTWNWPNADRKFKGQQMALGELGVEYSLVVANATEADLGTYWLSVASRSDDAQLSWIRIVVLRRDGD